MNPRSESQARKTGETDVSVTLNLDGAGNYKISTGIAFFDHMLRHIAVHGCFDLEVRAKGDLEVDAHHTVEDTAIVLGAALDQALGDRTGIKRIGSSFVPMDDALVLVAVDLSGRGYAVVDADLGSPMLGTMASSLVGHFFETLATRARMNLHARILYGRDDHHKAEALFKALGRALAQAVELDPRRQTTSTKGTLE